MKLPSRKTTLITAAAVGGVALLGAGAAVAVVGPDTATSVVRAGLDLDDDDTKITGTVKAPRGHSVLDDTQEEQALRQAATISAEEAATAATEAVPGSSVLENSLDEEDGFVVYEVEVRSAEGTVTEVVVDAGNGSVLAREVEDDDDDHQQPGQEQAPQPNAPQTGAPQTDAPQQGAPDAGQPQNQQPAQPAPTP